MRAALAGDESAYRALLEDLARRLRVVVRSAFARAGRSAWDVEDIVQDTLLTVHLKRHTWRSDQPFAPWVNAIARHKTIDALRRAKLHAPIDDVLDTLAAPSRAEHAEGDVTRVLSLLGARARRIVEAVSLEGRSMREVADELAMSEGAVRVALHRALKDLARVYRARDEA